MCSPILFPDDNQIFGLDEVQESGGMSAHQDLRRTIPQHVD